MGVFDYQNHRQLIGLTRRGYQRQFPVAFYKPAAQEFQTVLQFRRTTLTGQKNN
jgi:hypothetical protein